MKTIIFAHPWHGSFNKSILDTVLLNLERKKQNFTVIDLNKDGFNPTLTEKELALFSKGKSLDPLVQKYQEILLRTTDLIFIFPIWWADAPAIIKGFIDKVMLKNYAYTENAFGLKGLLVNIKKATVITTATAPKLYLQFFAGNSIKKTFINYTLKSIGINKGKWIHSGHTKPENIKQREAFLKSLNEYNF